VEERLKCAGRRDSSARGGGIGVRVEEELECAWRRNCSVRGGESGVRGRYEFWCAGRCKFGARGRTSFRAQRISVVWRIDFRLSGGREWFGSFRLFRGSEIVEFTVIQRSSR
jgi:hypothetical protein